MMQRTLILLVLALFGALTAAALWHHGYLGIFLLPLQTLAGTQVLVDLVIALVLVRPDQFVAWASRDMQMTVPVASRILESVTGRI